MAIGDDIKIRPEGSFVKLLVAFLLFSLLVLPAGCAGLRTEVEKQEPIAFSLLYFNDLHGHLVPFKVKGEDGGIREVGGIGRVATIIQKIREENASRRIRTVVLVAGDILQGTPMSTVFQGEPDILALNAIGVDAMTVGNHEFDFGLDNFLKLKSAARFPIISANIFYKQSGEALCDSGMELKLTDRVFLTIIGVTTEQLMTTTLPSNVEMLTVQDPVSSLKAPYEAGSRRGPVLLLSHSRHQSDREIARSYPRLTAIIGGHDQILLDPYRREGAVPIFQAFEKGRYVGRAEFLVDPVTFESKLVAWSYIPVTADIEPDKGVSALVDTYQAQLDDKFKTVIGHAGTFMDAERERIRYEETNLGNWVTDVMLANTGAEIALLNSGSLRASIAEGPITIADVFRAMPYENTLMTVTLTGKELLAVLNRSVSGTREEEDGGFLHVSGIRVFTRNGQVESVHVGPNGGHLDPERVYRVVITNFMASGGDGYTWFLGKEFENTQLPLRELLITAIQRQKIIHANVEGRISR